MIFKFTNSLIYLLFLFLLAACNDSNRSDFVKVNNSKRDYIETGDFSNLKGIDTTNTVLVAQYIIEDNKDTLLLKNLNELTGDPQFFSIVKFRSKSAVYELKNIQGYKIDPKTKINLQNQVVSDLIFLTENSNKEKLAFIWDYQYPDCSNLFEIIKFTKPKPIKILSEEILVKEISINEAKTVLIISALENCGETKKVIKVNVE